jgi:hypothetical protein
MLQFPVNFFSVQAAGLSAVVAAQVPVPAAVCSGLLLVAVANRPSPSPALASCRSNPCLYVRVNFPSDLLTSVQMVSKTRIKIKSKKIFSLSATFPKPAMSNGQKNKF